MMQSLIIDKSTIKQKIIRLAHEIVEDQFEEEEICLVGIVNGGHQVAKILRCISEKKYIYIIKPDVCDAFSNPQGDRDI